MKAVVKLVPMNQHHTILNLIYCYWQLLFHISFIITYNGTLPFSMKQVVKMATFELHIKYKWFSKHFLESKNEGNHIWYTVKDFNVKD